MSDTAPMGCRSFSFGSDVSTDIPIRKDISVAVRAGEPLFQGCDEAAGVERFSPDGSGWGHHRHVPPAALFDLPEGRGSAEDIEMPAEGGK